MDIIKNDIKKEYKMCMRLLQVMIFLIQEKK